MSLNEMKRKRAALVAEARKILDRAEEEKRDLSAEEKDSYDKFFADIRSLGEAIKREEELREAERAMAEEERNKEGETQKETRKAAAFRNFIINGDSSEYRALANDTGTAGGYLHAPEEFIAKLLKGLDNRVFVRNNATILPVQTSDSLGAPTLDADMSDPTWTTEIANVDEDLSMDFGKRNLTPQQLSKLVKVSMKLLRTAAISPETIVADRLAYRFAITQENAYLNGDGAGKPLGIFSASANGIPVSRDVSEGNTATEITADGLISVKFALKAQYRGKARWIFHRDALKSISKLKDNDGQYIWRPGLITTEPDTLLGLPIDESEYAPNTFTTGKYVGALCNWEYYWIAELMGMEIQRLNELYAATSQIGFIGRGYWDGAPVLAEAFARVKLA